MVESIQAVLMRRDGLTREEAEQRVEGFKSYLNNAIAEGMDYDEAEEAIADEFGLEPDYLDQLIY